MSTSVLPRPEVAPPRPWSFPAATELTLDNGLQVFAYHLAGKRLISVRLLLDVPLHVEPAGREGIAQLALDLLSSGTQSLDAQAFATALNRMAATYNAGCDHYGATVSLDVPASKLATGVELLADSVLRPVFPAEEVSRLVQQRLDGIAAERANPASRALLELAAAYYAPGSRRGLPAGGTTETVAGLDRELIAEFYAGQIDPATSALVIAGDLSGLDVAELLSASFGTWQIQGRTKTAAPVDIPVAGPKVVVVDRPGSVQTQVLLATAGVSRTSPDLPALLVSANALGGGLDSRLMLVLREEKGYTYGVSCMVAPDVTDGRILAGGAVQTEVTTPAVEDLITILRTFVSEGIRSDEHANAVESIAGKAPLSYELPKAVAGMAAQVLSQGLPRDFVDQSLAGLRASTVESVNETVARCLSFDQAVLVCVGDGALIAEGLKVAGLGDPVVVPA